MKQHRHSPIRNSASTLVQKSSARGTEQLHGPAHTQQVPQCLPNKAQPHLLGLAFKAFHELAQPANEAPS